MSNMESMPKKRTVLGPDGELKDEVDFPIPNQDPIYCTRCGTDNPFDANFCRKCGNPLAAGTAGPKMARAAAPQRKLKNDELSDEELDEDDEVAPDSAPGDWREMKQAAKDARRRAKLAAREARHANRGEIFAAPMEGMRSGGLSSVLSMLTMFFATAMIITSLVLHGGSDGWMSIPIIGAWFLVEGARRALRKTLTGLSFAIELITMIFVTGMMSSALVMHGGSNAWVGIIILLGWFLVTGARGALHKVVSGVTVVTEIGTMALVTALVSATMVFAGGSNAWLSVPILIGWFLLTGDARRARRVMKPE